MRTKPERGSTPRTPCWARPGRSRRLRPIWVPGKSDRVCRRLSNSFASAQRSILSGTALAPRHRAAAGTRLGSQSSMRERLVQRRNLGRSLLVEAVVPPDLAIEDLMEMPPPNWRALGSPEAAAAGGAWAVTGRTSLLRVPSALVPREANYLVNPAHPDARRIEVSLPEPLEWDARLFVGSVAPATIAGAWPRPQCIVT
jgi:hypothetical protein